MSSKGGRVFEHINGNRGVRIRDERYGDTERFELLWMKNGWQWSGAGVDAELLRMIRDICDDALNHINQDQKNEQ